MSPDQTPAAIFVAVLAILCAVAWLAAGVATFVWLWRARGNADPADVELPGAFRSVDGSGNVRVIGKADPS